MAALDAELLSLLAPMSAPKMDWTQIPAKALSTAIFWSSPTFGPLTTIRERLERTAKVSVFTYQEQGER